MANIDLIRNCRMQPLGCTENNEFAVGRKPPNPTIFHLIITCSGMGLVIVFIEFISKNNIRIIERRGKYAYVFRIYYSGSHRKK